MNKRFFVVIAVVVAALLGTFWFSTKKTHSPGTNGAQPSNHSVGTGTSGVTLIEYGDFQCPACGAYFPIVKQVKVNFGDKITFQFRNFPLVQIHPNAMAAHRAAEAAANQDKFWEMHDMLYERQKLWTSSQNAANIFESYAGELGLDMVRYRQDIVSETVFGVINADIREGQKIGAVSTPTFVLDGKKIGDNPRTLEDFIKLVDTAIKARSSNAQ